MPAPADSEPSLAEFVRALPKTETHLHFEGALPIEALRQVRPESPARSWRDGFRFDGFEHFLAELLDKQGAWFTSVERYHVAARHLFARHVAENVRYVEVSIATGALEGAGLDAREVLSALREAVPAGLVVRLFLGIHHDGHTPAMRPVLEQCLGWSQLTGIDLHGAEDAPLEPWTAQLWRAARERGKFTKAHAGEFLGPEFIRRILAELDPMRIEHGVRAVEDPSLVAELARRRIPLDMCPISNAALMPGISLENHPIARLHAAGVLVTLSTDDPLSFGNSVSDEYIALGERGGVSRRTLIDLAKNGFRVALLPDAEKRDFMGELNVLQAQLRSE